MPVEVDTSGLSKAINERLKFPGRTEAQIVNNSAYHVALNTKDSTPFASVPKIDAELKVSANHFITKSGAVSKTKRKAYGMGDKVTDVPLAALIIMARAKPSSNYNQRTNNRFALSKNPFKGVTRREGIRAMKEAVKKLLAGRHKSSKFILSGWLPAIKALGNAARMNVPIAVDGDARGSGTPAIEGKWTAQATIENATGLEGVNAANANQALLKYSGPALQASINKEERLMVDKMAKMTQAQNDKFNAMCR